MRPWGYYEWILDEDSNIRTRIKGKRRFQFPPLGPNVRPKQRPNGRPPSLHGSARSGIFVKWAKLVMGLGPRKVRKCRWSAHGSEPVHHGGPICNSNEREAQLQEPSSPLRHRRRLVDLHRLLPWPSQRIVSEGFSRSCPDLSFRPVGGMTVFHFFNCAILTFGPHAVYYSATPLWVLNIQIWSQFGSCNLWLRSCLLQWNPLGLYFSSRPSSLVAVDSCIV